MFICEWLCLSDSKSLYHSLTSCFYLLYVISSCSWWVWNNLYWCILYLKQISWPSAWVAWGKFSWFCSKYFLLIYNDSNCSVKIPNHEDFKRENFNSSHPSAFPCFISCTSHFNSMRQVPFYIYHMTNKGFGNLCNLLKSQSNQRQNQNRNTGIFNDTICTFHWNGMLVFSSPRLFISIFLIFIFPFAWISLSTYWKFSSILLYIF